MVKPTPRGTTSKFAQIAPGGMKAGRGLPNEKEPNRPSYKPDENSALAGLNKAIARVGKRRFGSFA
jgi:hypothetical protein